MGGWLIPGMQSTGPQAGMGVVLMGVGAFTAKVWIVLAAARALGCAQLKERRQRSMEMRRVAIFSGLVVLGAVFVAGWEFLPVPDDLRAAGRTVSTGLFFSLVAAFVTTRIHLWRREETSLTPQ
jgi:hypothetical protein